MIKYLMMMEMNKLLSVVALISILFFGSCGDDDNEMDLMPNTPLDEMAEEYGLFHSGIKIEGVDLGIDTTKVFFNGRQDKKLWIGCYDRITKAEMFHWLESTILDTIVSVDDGYGNQSQHYIDEFQLRSAYKKGDNYAFILWGQSNAEQRIITSDLYFVSNQKSTKERTYIYSSINNFFWNFSPWYENSIIVELSMDKNFRQSAIYNLSGDKLFESQTGIMNDYKAVGIEDFICFSGGVNGIFYRENCKTNTIVWDSEKPLGDLPGDIKIDRIELTQEDDEFVMFVFDYTLSSGEKKQRKGKVDIELGIISIL